MLTYIHAYAHKYICTYIHNSVNDESFKFLCWNSSAKASLTVTRHFHIIETGGINKKSIKLSKLDEVQNIIFKVLGGCFLYRIKIADNMSEKTADKRTKTPPR